MSITITITREELLALKPCEGRRDVALASIDWNAGGAVDAAAARAAEVPFCDTLWVVSALAQNNMDVRRRLTLFTADCAARVLHYYEEWPSATGAARAAIVAARQFARGEITDAAMNDASNAASDAASDASNAAWAASNVVWAASNVVWAASNAASDAASAASNAAWAASNVVWAASNVVWAASNAAWAASNVVWAASNAARAASDAASDAEDRWQFDRLIAWLSDNEPEDWPLD